MACLVARSHLFSRAATGYCETLTKLRRTIHNRRRAMLRKGVSILHDNARSHAARQTVTPLQRFGREIITTPPLQFDFSTVTSIPASFLDN